ncbi:hypothetical protein VTI74DRAFT_7716 [Chaetomium olivicolor]
MSSPTSAPLLFTSTYATLSIHQSSTLRLLNLPSDIIAALEAVIRTAWPHGIESHGTMGKAYNYKVKGAPFGLYRSHYHVDGIRLLRDVLAFLYAHGWEVMTSVLCSRRYTGKDTLVLRKADGALPRGDVEWLGLAPMSSDKLRVVYDPEGGRRRAGGSDGGAGDYDYMGVLISSMKSILVDMDYFQKGAWSDDSFAFDLKGAPWRASGEESVKTRVLLMRLLQTMEAHGWRLYTTVVQRTGSDEDRVLDTWYFVRERQRAREAGGGGAEKW